MARADQRGAGQVLRAGDWFGICICDMIRYSSLYLFTSKYLAENLLFEDASIHSPHPIQKKHPHDDFFLLRQGKSGNCTCRYHLQKFWNILARNIIYKYRNTRALQWEIQFTESFYTDCRFVLMIFSCCRCTRAGRRETTMPRPRKLQIITLQVSHCFYKFHICCAFLQSICFKRGLFFCVQKKKRKREKTQDSGGETSNDCRSHWKGRCRLNWRVTLQMKRHKFAIVQKWSANFW